MKIRNRVTAGIVTTALAGTLMLASGQAATATTPARTSAPVASTAVASSVAAGLGSTAPTPPTPSPVQLPAPTPALGDGGGASTTAIPIAVRLAVKAALEVVKRTSTTWYNNIIRYVNNGRTAFVNWWNTSVPGWVKTLFGGVSASAIYDAIRWIIGI
ncbi:hypothetical protein [Cellulomonas pakistanensis]|uniref:Uncharacterized protein n=1 Tax=Cellulomonas pakistanensis TaxID=992287 RepID=A0A919PA89_9CELL|nr:hypothetical protein [Cellulomonas pakistanensis]GIG35896.1 hypothetical protein Cpa01nite_12770 [Cellulomonas pakistanensis]